jgi:hypothetical protein
VPGSYFLLYRCLTFPFSSIVLLLFLLFFFFHMKVLSLLILMKSP